MSDHTPGPWTWFRGYLTTCNADGSIPVGSRIVADSMNITNPADKCLIAAAPELLAEGMAAEATLTLVLLTVSLPEELHTQVRDDLTTLRAGIAKATGP